jgi:hypothetical protein
MHFLRKARAQEQRAKRHAVVAVGFIMDLCIAAPSLASLAADLVRIIGACNPVLMLIASHGGFA